MICLLCLSCKCTATFSVRMVQACRCCAPLKSAHCLSALLWNRWTEHLMMRSQRLWPLWRSVKGLGRPLQNGERTSWLISMKKSACNTGPLAQTPHWSCTILFSRQICVLRKWGCVRLLGRHTSTSASASLILFFLSWKHLVEWMLHRKWENEQALYYS